MAISQISYLDSLSIVLSVTCSQVPVCLMHQYPMTIRLKRMIMTEGKVRGKD